MIDRSEARDRDDAIWVVPAGDGWDAVAHIASVVDRVPLASEADQRASRQLRTIYLPDNKTVPMLPRGVQHAAALHPDLPRETLSVFFHIGDDGAVSGAHLAKGRLDSPVAMDYSEAAAAVTDPDHPWHRTLRAAHEAARALLARRRAQGALVLYDLRRGWASDGDRGLCPLIASERTTGYVLVSELMVAANAAIAEFAVVNNLPILFRNHVPAASTPAREELLDELRVLASDDTEPWRRDATHRRLSLLLRPAVYAPQVSEHYGLQLPWYCHATSPLRRYADLVVQRQLWAALRGETPPYTTDMLAGHADAINDKLRQVQEQRRERNAELSKGRHRDTLVAGNLTGLSAAEFHAILKLTLADACHSHDLESELLRRAATGQLQARDAYLVLMAADDRWSVVRDTTFQWLVQHPEHAVTLVSMHIQANGAPAPVWDEHAVGTVSQPQFCAQVRIEVGGGTTCSAQRIARAKNPARQQAALSLLAGIIGMADPSTSLAEPSPASSSSAVTVPAGSNPLMVVNEWRQTGRLTDLHFDIDSSGPPHGPTFTCTARAWHPVSERHMAATYDGGTKTDAKYAAAAALCAQVRAIETSATTDAVVALGGTPS